jgi:uncharacterized protein
MTSLNRARRRFLGTSAVAAGGILITACGSERRDDTAPTDEPQTAAEPATVAEPETFPSEALAYGTLLCGGSRINPENNEKVWVFSQVNMDRVMEQKGAGEDNTRLIIDIGFLAHGIAFHPLNPSRIAVFEKGGRGACEIDLRENVISRRIQPSDNGAFYGHGAYSPDGTVLYATEYDRDTYDGRMVVRDAKDLDVIEWFPTHGEWPHDCTFIDKGRVVAITNGGGHINGGATPNVTYVEVPTGKLIEKIEFNNPMLNAGHLLVSGRGDLAIAHAMREGYHGELAIGALSLRPYGKRLRTMVSPAEVTSAMLGETLSIIMHEESGIVAATNPYGANGGLVTFWKMDEQKFVHRLNVPQPRGVALSIDRKHWVITFGVERSGVILAKVETHEPGDPPKIFECSSQGSHAYVHNYWPKGV